VASSRPPHGWGSRLPPLGRGRDDRPLPRLGIVGRRGAAFEAPDRGAHRVEEAALLARGRPVGRLRHGGAIVEAEAAAGPPAALLRAAPPGPCPDVDPPGEAPLGVLDPPALRVPLHGAHGLLPVIRASPKGESRDPETMAGRAPGVPASRGPVSAVRHVAPHCARDDRRRFTRASSFPRREAAGVMGGSGRRGTAPRRLTHPAFRPFMTKGMAGARRTPSDSVLTALVGAPAAASFQPRPPRFRVGERRGHGALCPYPSSPTPWGSSPAGAGAPPLSHPVATARSGGGRTWSRLPGAFGPSSSPMGCGRNRQRTSPAASHRDTPQAPHPTPSVGRHR